MFKKVNQKQPLPNTPLKLKKMKNIWKMKVKKENQKQLNSMKESQNTKNSLKPWKNV